MKEKKKLNQNVSTGPAADHKFRIQFNYIFLVNVDCFFSNVFPNICIQYISDVTAPLVAVSHVPPGSVGADGGETTTRGSEDESFNLLLPVFVCLVFF